MKNLLLTFVLFICTSVAFCQNDIVVTPIIQPPYSPYLADYTSLDGKLLIQVMNLSNQVREIKIKAVLTGDNRISIRTGANFNPPAPIVLEPGEIRTFAAIEENQNFLDPYEIDVVAPDRIKNSILTTGIIPEGTYTLCLQALDYASGRPLSGEQPAGCQIFPITYVQPPSIISPMCGDSLYSPNPVFSWTPPLGHTGLSEIEYDLYILPVIDDENPEFEMELAIDQHAGNPIVIRDLNMTNYVYRPSDIQLEPGLHALMVVARDRSERIHFENQGRSEICLVNVRNPVEISTEGRNPPLHNVLEPSSEDYQLLQQSTMEGRLLYSFYGDVSNKGPEIIPGTSNPAMTSLASNQEPMIPKIQYGNSLENQAAHFSNNAMAAGFGQPLPPQFLLPTGYSTSGGKPLKHAGIRFTARYAVGKTIIVSQPDDLIYIDDYGPMKVTGSQIPEGILIDDGADRVIATTTPDDNGYYHVSFMADEFFGVLASGPVEVPTGSGEFKKTITGYGLYRVITMEVEEKWYCHPDVIIFLQPGQSLDVPDQRVYVLSYNLAVTVVPQEGFLQAAGEENLIPDVVVKLGKKKYILDNAPECYPNDEVSIESYGQQWENSPFNTVLLDSFYSEEGAKVLFERLVRHDGQGGCGGIFDNDYWPDDGYYLEAYSHPTIGPYNYGKNWVSKLAPCGARLPALTGAPRSRDYIPPVITYEMTLLPSFPKIRLNTRVTYDQVPYDLPHTDFIVFVFDEDDKLIGGIIDQTDQNGLYEKQFTWPTDVNNHLMTLDPGPPKEITSKYIIEYGKPGFKNDNCNACGTFDVKQELQWGQSWEVEAKLLPNSKVRGKVEDEHGQPIYAKVKIGDGPYLSLDMTFQAPGNDPDGPVFQTAPDLGTSSESTTFQNQSNSTSYQVLKGGKTVDYQNGLPTVTGVEKDSYFYQSAQSGHQIPLIIRPEASNYFPDTFYVNIPEQFEGPYFDLGTFVIREKLHRPRIFVYDLAGPVLDDSGLLTPNLTHHYLEGLQVTVSNLPSKITNSQGFAQFVFGSPSNEFRIQVHKEGYVPIDQYMTIPPTKEPYDIWILIDPGRSIFGIVTRSANSEPIPGARVFTEIGVNEYGPVIVEAFTDSTGSYHLSGLPKNWLIVIATKTGDPDVTYIGQEKEVNSVDSVLHFALEEAPFHMTEIWNLPVELESIVPVSGGWSVDGAFVDLPENQHFKPLNKSQRLVFTNLQVELTDSTGNQVLVHPQSNHIKTKTIKFQAVLNDAHIVEMSGQNSDFTVGLSEEEIGQISPQNSTKISTDGNNGNPSQSNNTFQYSPQFAPVVIDEVRVDRDVEGNGHIKTRALTMLEWFRFTYNYDGQFYLGENPVNNVISSFIGTVGNSPAPMPETYYLMTDNNWQNQITANTQPDFMVHYFPAVFDRYESYVREDSMILSTKLIVDLPKSNPDILIVSTGNVVVLPEKIIVNEGNQPLEFDLENWHVETGNWSFSDEMGGIKTQGGKITTDILEIPVPYIVIKPHALNLPSVNQINLNQLNLGGVVDMDIDPAAKLTFDYVNSSEHSPGIGHWRIVLSHPQQGQDVAGIQGLPGWPDQTEVNIRFIENFSDSHLDLSVAPDQEINHYNMIKQSVNKIYLYEGGVSFSGNTDLEIPNLSSGHPANFIYYKEENQVQMKILGLNISFETKGMVEFVGDQQADRILLDWDYFEVIGDLTIYDVATSHEIPLRANLIKEPGDIRIEVIDVDDANNPELEGSNKQIIHFEGGGDSRQRVLEGSQHVVGNQWAGLKYHAQFENFGAAFEGPDTQDKMWFVVYGDIKNDPNAGDQIQLNNIKTPFGDFSLIFHLDEMVIDGQLSISNFPMGTVFVNDGSLNMRMGAPGFYLAGQIDAVYPVIGQLLTNFITGSYPALPASALSDLKKGMYVQKLPSFLIDSGIQGLYMSASKPFFNGGYGPFVIPPIAVDVYASAGIDARFWLNFGDAYGAAALAGLAYANIGMSVYSLTPPCEVCAGVMAELGFQAEFQWEPSTYFEISTCGAIGLYASFCDLADFSESAKLEMAWNSNGGFDVNVALGETCSGNDTAQNDKGCD